MCSPREQVNRMKEFFDRSTAVLSEEDAGFAPVEGMFTTAQQIAHVAQTVDWFVEGAFLRNNGFDMDFASHELLLRRVTTLAEARAWWERSCARAIEVGEKATPEELSAPIPNDNIFGGQAPRCAVFGAMEDHTAHHRGALTVYARLLGKVAPMPYA
ncbi:MAG: DinB family protein [Candidatus Sumerlaeia bacterium]|nr:DinB family protein [Candidatus Sumerlaeia bacterium]